MSAIGDFQPAFMCYDPSPVDTSGGGWQTVKSYNAQPSVPPGEFIIRGMAAIARASGTGALLVRITMSGTVVLNFTTASVVGKHVIDFQIYGSGDMEQKAMGSRFNIDSDAAVGAADLTVPFTLEIQVDPAVVSDVWRAHLLVIEHWKK